MALDLARPDGLVVVGYGPENGLTHGLLASIDLN